MMMKPVFALACVAASAYAQSIAIGAPTAGNSLNPGSNITVEVEKPNAQQSSNDVAIVIAVNSCGGQCNPSSVNSSLGQILYSGPFNAQPSSNPAMPPSQNFTVTVPQSLAQGPAALTVTHFFLAGAGPSPAFEVESVNLLVQ